ncbi:DUF488 domain-containing protein [Paucibacter sp. AS339]|uniref:DUF488 domain-containing protein n=1 Tax=Paucibacter hankyongi TaxID=3133434 RepID=UPI00309D211D
MKMAAKSLKPERLVVTIGHSNRTIEEFIALLWTNEVAEVIDVRTIPRSRHNPQFNLDALPASLAAAGIEYSYREGLGGLRHAHADSPNMAWHNASFRGYADYMQSAEFADNVDDIVKLAGSRRCHRSLISDAILVRGVRVEDIIGPHGRKAHTMTSFAHIDGLTVTYPAAESALEGAKP